MNDEEFEEWIAAQERGDRAKIAALRRLLIIKKLAINTVSEGAEFSRDSQSELDFEE